MMGDTNLANVPWKLLSLVVGLFLLVLLAYWATGPSAPDAPPPAQVTGEVPAPPRDVSRDSRAAAAYVQGETCRASCTAADRSCRAMALDEADRLAACVTERAGCEARCR